MGTIGRPIGSRAPFILGGLNRKDVRGRGQFLPLRCAIERRAAVGEHPIYAAIVDAFAREPFPKLLLFVRGDLGDRLALPELLPMGEAVPCRRCARKFLCVVDPVVDEHALDQDLVRAGFAAVLVVFDNPVG